MTSNSVCAQQKQKNKAYLRLENSLRKYFNSKISMSQLTKQEFIVGDFNGDRQPDTLTVSFVSSIDNTPIIIDTVSDYDQLIQKTVAKKPILQLISNNLRTLNLNEDNLYILGLDVLQNIGNINAIRGDDIAVILRAADWSGINTYTIYSYRRSRWIKIKETEVREEEIPDIRTGKSKPWKR
ncbi:MULTISPECIES: hypothetical protein [Chryseobacterium]|uniref:hypothetical protein n=1 Tax=Chryseobacterium TaxID=59732 RepID=UPI001297B9CA|nr:MULTISPECIES: hypothetical protein [Chryseobacterium]MDR6919717.1 hypothetical protein [Chryseobacterium sp. 2987]